MPCGPRQHTATEIQTIRYKICCSKDRQLVSVVETSVQWIINASHACINLSKLAMLHWKSEPIGRDQCWIQQRYSGKSEENMRQRWRYLRKRLHNSRRHDVISRKCTKFTSAFTYTYKPSIVTFFKDVDRIVFQELQFVLIHWSIRKQGLIPAEKTTHVTGLIPNNEISVTLWSRRIGSFVSKLSRW